MECLFLTAPHTIFFKSVEVERQLSSKKTADTGQLSVSRSIVVMARGSQGWRKSTFWSQSLTNGICTNTSINWDSKILTVAYRSSVELFLETIPYYIHQVWKEKPKDLLLGYYSGCHSRIVSSSGDVSVNWKARKVWITKNLMRHLNYWSQNSLSVWCCKCSLSTEYTRLQVQTPAQRKTNKNSITFTISFKTLANSNSGILDKVKFS